MLSKIILKFRLSFYFSTWCTWNKCLAHKAIRLHQASGIVSLLPWFSPYIFRSFGFMLACIQSLSLTVMISHLNPLRCEYLFRVSVRASYLEHILLVTIWNGSLCILSFCSGKICKNKTHTHFYGFYSLKRIVWIHLVEGNEMNHYSRVFRLRYTFTFPSQLKCCECVDHPLFGSWYLSWNIPCSQPSST